MLTVIYDPVKGLATPDGKAKEVAESICRRAVVTDTSSHLVIDWLRVMLVEGDIEDLCIIFRGAEYILDKHGRLHNWPEGLCDHTQRVLGRLLLGRNKEKNNENTTGSI